MQLRDVTRAFMVSCTQVVSGWGNGALRKVFLSMTPERADSATNPYSEPLQSSRRRRHHRRSFYTLWIRPYRRELRTILLFCLVVIATYLLWDAVVAN